MKAAAGSFNVILGTTSDPENSAEAQLLKEQLEEAGISAEIAQFDQATLINKALSGDIDVLLWRNLHGGFTNSSDVDNYPWWSNQNTGNLINFSHFNNDETQSLLEQGRGESEKSAIDKTYTDFNKAMAENNYIVPAWYVDWTIGYLPDVKPDAAEAARRSGQAAVRVRTHPRPRAEQVLGGARTKGYR